MGVFRRLVLSQDMLGHPLSVNYKGEQAYRTVVGAVVSTGIRVLTLVQLITLSISMLEMQDPNI